MKTTTIRIEMSGNGPARDCQVRGKSCFGGFPGAVRHAGGRVVTATIETADLDAARAWLDDSGSAIVSYEVAS